MNVSERLAQAGLELPPPINPLGSYRTVSVSGSQLYQLVAGFLRGLNLSASRIRTGFCDLRGEIG
jgi:hypothetical protein